jgi:hypothetical protein
MDPRTTTDRSFRTVGALVASLMIVAACSSTPSASTPAPSPSAAPSVGPSAAVASPSLSPSPTPSASPVAIPSPTDTPIPSLPDVGEAPAGNWSSIHWLRAGDLGVTGNDIQVHGWSGGYIALDQSGGSDDQGNPTPVTIRAAFSSDGIHWAAPTTLQTGFKGMFQIRDIVEGPNGLLALAYPYGDTCGGPESVYAMWSSPDGQSWTRIAMPKTFSANHVETISGGAAGYIAFGGKGDTTTPMIWTSPDGTAWTVRPLPTVSSGTLVIDQVASFGTGFIVLGGVLGEGGCGGGAHIKPAVWFSTTGASWTRASLPGASTDPNASMSMRASGDRLLVVQILPGDMPTGPAWTSTDGRTFTSIGKLPSDTIWGSATDGRHSVSFVGPESGTGPVLMTEVDPMGAATTLRQDGDQPLIAEDGAQIEFAIGRTGILAYTGDGIESWIGVPS